jgi:hypothetical protein
MEGMDKITKGRTAESTWAKSPWAVKLAQSDANSTKKYCNCRFFSKVAYLKKFQKGLVPFSKIHFHISHSYSKPLLDIENNLYDCLQMDSPKELVGSSKPCNM